MGFLKDLIFPPKCIFCGEFLRENYHKDEDFRVCYSCQEHMVACAGDGTFESRGNMVDYIIAPLSYQQPPVQRALCFYKFQNRKVYANTLSRIMADSVLKNKALFSSLQSYAVTAVPLSKERLLERGYNQSAELAKRVSQFLGSEYIENALVKVRHTSRQSSLPTASQRAANLVNAYRPTQTLFGKNILLVDDIYTTGSTLNECAKMLKEAGTNHVVGMCAAINRDFAWDDFRQSVLENTPVWR